LVILNIFELVESVAVGVVHYMEVDDEAMNVRMLFCPFYFHGDLD